MDENNSKENCDKWKLLDSHNFLDQLHPKKKVKVKFEGATLQCKKVKQ
jgi:hypothetical protein